MRIAIDAMGSDQRPQPDVAGSVQAARDFGETIVLVGPQTQVEQELAKHDTTGLSIEVADAPQVIEMSDKPTSVGRDKPQSTMHIGTSLVKAGEADAFVTAGNTGAAMAIATLNSLGRIKGVKRPAISSIVELAGQVFTLVDIGANTDTKLDWLLQFAVMGNIYSQKAQGIASPRVALLSNGEEEGKGDQLIRDAGPILKQMPLNFIGNVEPLDILQGKADVVVADGFVGNILIKSFEGAIETMFTLMRQEFGRDIISTAQGAIARPVLRRVYDLIDPSKQGGAPLLGINGVVIIAHGGSNERAIRNAIRQARQAVQGDVISSIADGIAEMQLPE